MRRRGLRIRVVAAMVVLLVSVALAALVAVAVVDPTTFWRVDGEAVAESLERAGDGYNALPPCDPRGKDRWLCAVEHDPGSGRSDLYGVSVDGDCWQADRVKNRDPTTPRRVEGCFELFDFVWP